MEPTSCGISVTDPVCQLFFYCIFLRSYFQPTNMFAFELSIFLFRFLYSADLCLSTVVRPFIGSFGSFSLPSYYTISVHFLDSSIFPSLAAFLSVTFVHLGRLPPPRPLGSACPRSHLACVLRHMSLACFSLCERPGVHSYEPVEWGQSPDA